MRLRKGNPGGALMRVTEHGSMLAEVPLPAGGLVTVVGSSSESDSDGAASHTRIEAGSCPGHHGAASWHVIRRAIMRWMDEPSLGERRWQRGLARLCTRRVVRESAWYVVLNVLMIFKGTITLICQVQSFI